MISPQTYQTRRQQLMASVETDLIIISANHSIQRSTSTAYPFFQDRHFYYYTGIEEPGWALVIDELQGREWLIKPKVSRYIELFDGVAEDADIAKASNVTDIQENREGWHKMSQLLKSRNSIGTFVSPTKFSAVYGMFLSPSRRALVERLKRYNRALNIVDIGRESGRLRSVKDEQELALIRHAIGVTGTALKNVRDNLQAYTSENQIAAEIQKQFLLENCEQGFDSIVASGKNATIMHYVANNQSLPPDSFVLLDIGAQHSYYSADITRTYAYGSVSQRHKDVYAAVKQVQQDAYELLCPGVQLREYESQVEQLMGVALNKLGLISSMLRKDIRTYFPTATSHFLGLDVHDVGDYDHPLHPGTVLTVEPGIYIPEEGIGVRIEDDIVIVDDGIAILSADIPSEM